MFPQPSPFDPWSFISEYAEPAFEVWLADRLSKHLAAHAIAQVDILAAVVANRQLLGGRHSLEGREEGRFRDEIERRIPVLRVIRDAHDAHKHGRLRLATRNFAAGFDPQAKARKPIFPPAFLTPSRPVLLLTLADDTDRSVEGLLVEAMGRWHEELKRLGLTDTRALLRGNATT